MATLVEQVDSSAMAALQAQLDQLHASTTALQTSQNQLATQTASTSQTVTALQQAQTTSATQVSTLQTTATTASQAIANSNTVHAQLQSEIDGLTSQLAAVQSTATAQAASITSQQAAITALQTALANKNKTLVAFGQTAIPTIVLAGTKTATISLSPNMVDTNYNVWWWTDASVVGKVGVTYTKATDKLTVTMTALLAVAAGANLYVAAIETI